MNKPTVTTIIDAVVLLVLAVLLVFLVNPFGWFMPSQLEMLLTAVFGALFALFIALFWREKAVDEREAAHMQFSGRVAFFVGTTVTTIGILVKSLEHTLDGWLPAILIAMIFAKYISRIYANRWK